MPAASPRARRPVAPPEGFRLWPERLDRPAQEALVAAVQEGLRQAPLFQPTMPRTGAAFSVQMSNFGPLGWVSDRTGYRYQDRHPVTGAAWPAMPDMVCALWRELSGYPHPPEACLINVYRGAARMGLHVDADEAAREAPVLSISLGDPALFRIGGARRSDPCAALWLSSGDVALLSGPARQAYHGVDRLRAGASRLAPGGGRINLTVRRVTPPRPG